jgi:HEAT repeat protein
MGFDFQNFGIGLLTGWATAYGVYRARHLISSAARSAGEQASSAGTFARQNADTRYINDLANLCENIHLGGRFTKLTDILIEPRFIPAPQLAAPPDDEVSFDVFYVVPQVPDHPYLQAPYNIETRSIDDLAKASSRRLALLGQPGSGRTTALLAIALKSLNRLALEPIEDKIQARLDAEEAKLSEKERAVKIKERLSMEQRAKEQLAKTQGMTFDAEADEEARTAVPLFNRLMPVYVHLADIDTRAAEFGPEIDPAEPLVRAVQRQMSRVTASTIPRNLYKRLNTGQVLLLIDGYDDLPEADRAAQIKWLEAFLAEYGNNFVIAVGPACGYGALTRLGFSPVFLRPWSDLDIQRVVNRWANVWSHMSGTKKRAAAKPDAKLIERARAKSRALSPLDLTMKIWASYADDADVPGVEGWLRSFLTRYLPSDQPLNTLLPQLAQAAALQLNEGFITQERLEVLAGVQVSSKTQTADDDDTAEEDGKSKKAKAKKDGAKEEAEAVSAQGKLISMLRRSGLLVRFANKRYQFRHAFIAAYLASLTFKEAGETALTAKALDPNWSQAIAYAATHTSIHAAVKARLDAPADVLQTHLLEVARWLGYASSDVPWRGPLLKQMGNLFLAPNQYPLTRERIAAALISTRDKNTLFVFRQAARNANADIRRLACLGIGALGEAEALPDLIPLLTDQSVDVQLAAAFALGVIGGDEALEALVEAFTEGSEKLRQAIAETFAAIPGEGHPILYDAIEHEEMMLRRAAVFGIRRIPANWALISIYRAFLEDDQWYVRSAAQQAFQELQGVDYGAPTVYPSVDSIPWLAEWASGHGERLPNGEAAQQVLLKALQEGEPSVRIMAAAVSGQLGLASNTKALYSTLRDRQDEVRIAAHRALADLQLQIGQPLPSPA